VIRKEVGEPGFHPLLRKHMALSSSKYTASQRSSMLHNKYTNRDSVTQRLPNFANAITVAHA